MTALVVMLEIEQPGTVHDLGGGERASEGRAALVVHAAPVAADGGPERRTFCGSDTSGLERDPWQPAEDAAVWYPSRWSQRVCEECAAAVRGR
ncbi:hypothetical protein AB0442_02615 [Kitasatospora sp. NPDC085895]|uniref:hypothetical protein n=1 Tax=Kitasatospora sp. NPDC085895 TaxID=3155057 RepID=UPI00344DF3E3